MNPTPIPHLERKHIKLLYLRLTDSAPLIVAKEQGFFSRVGLNVELQRETSWATLRDRLIGGTADGAAMLAPMPLTLAQALPQCEETLLTGLILSCNGNAITLSRRLSEELGISAGSADGAAAGSALARYLQAMPDTAPPLKLATVYPFSSHTLQLRHWLGVAGLAPDRKLQLLVLPPEQMVAALRRGDIDGYCVGEPWNTLAARQGLGTVVAACNILLPAMPEKVLAVTGSWHQSNPGTHLALRMALLQACNWLGQRSARADAVPVLARRDYLDLDPADLRPSLADQLHLGDRSRPVDNPGWHLFAHPDSDSGRPTEEKARQLLELCATFSPVAGATTHAFRADLYQQALDAVRLHRP
ncbi:CmpA/NrtA family ABC transporter substrate-binding protein [Microbulbifer yueqingensis]|uniref:Nitrate/nitrite transport system substrate-binding protein/nitrate/nitrite transport system ATP-binding protein n=1 Tax=Microbulbifer yueqingensis TaxID=658219 RepID=A0A1G8XLY6_9GAMM|nr:CmpA/NrtA family ABC transporter substrate-binding protein [Microbulbifer yueqingensis]SDJ91601.1 nitrate/nitrite transport system substrate-binding protein/nitrate/nitrite transport system ATP-binding protein [Microbulbifer yueqingensis]